MKTLPVALLVLLFTVVGLSTLYAQPTDNDATLAYKKELKAAGKTFVKYYYPNYASVHALPEKQFVYKIDSVRAVFNNTLNKYKGNFSTVYIGSQAAEIKYYFDKLLVDYAANHEMYSGEKAVLKIIPRRLQQNQPALNDPALLSNSDFTDYARALLAYRSWIEVRTRAYKKQDNQYLQAGWKLLPQFFKDPQCKSFWQYDCLYKHIDNNGIKNVRPFYDEFIRDCKDTSLLHKLVALYREDSIGREGHLTRVYKSVDGLSLDIHLFLPDNVKAGAQRPVIICFHGGSWSEGKADWFFEACSQYAKRGWVACAVEYRTAGRNGSLPMAAVMDAKSAIRWLRKNATEYNIDTGRIVATGNSAGGHMVLCTALSDNLNEATDDLRYGAVPNLLLVNSGVYDLSDITTKWIRYEAKNDELVDEIMPLKKVRAGIPPVLMIHGTADGNVPYASAKAFAEAMQKAGNDLEFSTLEGAEHFIWYDPKYASQVSQLRADFLKKHGYPQ
ncbi:MAG: alpha/beta hydrolase [Chitinophagaceae bacterium]